MILATHGLIAGNITLDSDAQAFITAAGITNTAEKLAVNYLVVQLKSLTVWTRLIALYPFVGGTATSHMYNLKNPLNTDAAFRLTFGGTVTHNSNGVTFSSSNGFANTHVIPNTHFVANKESIGLYSRTAAASPTVNEVDMGCAAGSTTRDQMILRLSTDATQLHINSTTSGGTVATTTTDASGFFIGARESSVLLSLYRNGALMVPVNTTANNGIRASIKMYIGARNVANVAQNFSGRNFALAFIGAELTAAEVASMYTIVQQYQTLLGRQV